MATILLEYTPLFDPGTESVPERGATFGGPKARPINGEGSPTLIVSRLPPMTAIMGTSTIKTQLGMYGHIA